MRSRRLVAALAAGCTGAIGAALVGTSRRIRLDGRPGPLQQADAILVFGAAVWPTGPSLSLEVRVARAAEVYSEGWAPVILCSGGMSSGVSEAMTMRRLLLARGIPGDAIIPDDGGTTTREAIRSARAFDGGRWRRVIAVSSPYHMHRIRCEAARHGLDVVLCPAVRPGPSTPELHAFDRRQHRREIMAVVSYAAGARVKALTAGRPLKLLQAAARHLVARVASFAGGPDAVRAASDVVGDRIKSSVADFSDTVATLSPAAAGLAWPVENAIVSPFGLRHRRLHAGVDIRGSYGVPVRAAAGGIVLLAERLGPYGNVTVVDHGGGLATVYAHQAGVIAYEGATVTRGQVLGYVGQTGRAFGPHLHFEVRVHGTPVNPAAYLS
jgi:murein DD-endopeptidase MepM/ murein hydrolase activator NlpD